LGVAIVSTSTLFPFIVGKYVIFRSSVALALLFFCLGVLFSKNDKAVFDRIKSVLKSPLVISVMAFVASFVLAGFFGVAPSFSFWSNFERGLGSLELLHFLVFFFLMVFHFREGKDWSKFFGWAIFGGVLMALYGILAASGFNGFLGGKWSDAGFRFSGSIGNPAYVAVFSLFLIFYVLYLLSVKYRGKMKESGAVFLMVLGVFFLVIFAFAATRGAFLGLIAAILAFLFYAGIASKRWRIKFIGAAMVVAAIVVILVAFKNVPFIKSLPFSRIFDISLSTKTFEDRAIMWKMAIDGFKERPVLGWGAENFTFVFDQNFNTAYFKPAEGFGAWFDRAHNVFFDYLAETGAVGLAAYCAMFVVFFLFLFRNSGITFRKKTGEDKNAAIQKERHLGVVEGGLLFAVIVSYLVQGIALFDVGITYINLFIVLAFAAHRFKSVGGSAVGVRGALGGKDNN